MDIVKLRAELTKEEAVRLKVYDDATGEDIHPGSHVVGHPTIGVGRALDTNGITPAEARHLLDNSIAETLNDLTRNVPFWAGLTEDQQRALCHMRFQMGLAGLLGFQKMLARLEDGDGAGARREALDSRWARQTPNRAARVAALLGG